jgi:hypothetical protein
LNKYDGDGLPIFCECRYILCLQQLIGGHLRERETQVDQINKNNREDADKKKTYMGNSKTKIKVPTDVEIS